jgi:two-component system cell cycle response regulator
MNPFDQETTRGPVRQPGTAPRPEEKPYLLGIAGEHAGRLFPLEGLREVFVGRGADCEISLQLDRDVSRRHARVSLDDAGRAWLEDLGSLNGTVVNGQDLTRPVMLGRGDRVYVGETCILKMDWLTADEVQRWQSATVDGLTECLNRASFQSRLDDLVALGRSRERPLSLVLLDVDRFKTVNDDYGHQAGDFVLQRVAAAMKSVLSDLPADLPAYRYGGEEFAVLLPEVGHDQARAIAERIRAAVEATGFAYQDLRLSVTVSAGVATLSGLEDAAGSDLIKTADERLYRAKREGRNRVVA